MSRDTALVCRDEQKHDSKHAKENGNAENGEAPSAEIAVIQEGDEKPRVDPEQGNVNRTPNNVVGFSALCQGCSS